MDLIYRKRQIPYQKCLYQVDIDYCQSNRELAFVEWSKCC